VGGGGVGGERYEKTRLFGTGRGDVRALIFLWVTQKVGANPGVRNKEMNDKKRPELGGQREIREASVVEK